MIKRSINLSGSVLALVAITIGALIYYASVGGFISDSTAFIYLTFVLLLYLLVEVTKLYIIDNRRFFLNPIFICSLMTLGMYYGINNVLYYMPAKLVAILGVSTVINPDMVKLQFMAVVAATGMWVGYWSTLTQKVIDTRYCKDLVLKYFTHDAEINQKVFAGILVFSVVMRLIQISLGVYGYSGSYDAYMKFASYTQYFMIAGYLGRLAQVVITIQFYRKERSNSTKFWFFTVLFIEVFLGGFLSGMKKNVIIPFIVVIFCQYARTGKMSLIWLVAIFMSISVAYPIIEQFRSVRNGMDTAFPSTSIVEITRITFSPSPSELAVAQPDATGDAPTWLKTIARTSMTQIGAIGIGYYDKYNGDMPDGAPEVVKEVLLSPLYSWIPRFIWSGKTVQNLGIWYTHVPMGLKYSFSSTAMGMITYLYMGGGWLIVFLGFAMVGGMQRIFMMVFQPWKTSQGALLIISATAMVGSIAELNLDALIVLIVRMMPIIILVQKYIYNHNANLSE